MLGSAPFVTASAGTRPLDQAEWTSFKARFTSPDGRIIDNANGGVSHSEGQGWGMLFAVAFDDAETFDRIYSWTRRTLRRPNDPLHAWRFIPTANPQIQDWNNATDGDLFIAAALAQAGRQWSRGSYIQDASLLGQAILSLTVRQVGRRLVMLPGVQGFETSGFVTINPSYYAFPMFKVLGRVTPGSEWNRLARDGQALIDQGRFGKWQLPPDWLQIARSDQHLSPAPGWPPRFGFDAIRVPLWSSWAGLSVAPAASAANRFWSAYPGDSFPAWVDLVSGETAPYAAASGLVAVSRLARATPAADSDILPSLSKASNYYDAALILLCHLAWRDRQPR